MAGASNNTVNIDLDSLKGIISKGDRQLVKAIENIPQPIIEKAPIGFKSGSFEERWLCP